MRNLLLLLALANVVYFAWSAWVATPTVNQGVSVRTEADLLPRYTEAPLDDDAPPPVVCREVYGFSEAAPAAALQASAVEAALAAEVVEYTEAVFVGHWVQVVGLADRAAGNRAVAALRDGGVAETFMAPQDDGSFAISLGLFSELERARSVEAQAQAAGVTPTLSERTRDEVRYKLVLAEADPAALNPWLAQVQPEQVRSCAEALRSEN